MTLLMLIIVVCPILYLAIEINKILDLITFDEDANTPKSFYTWTDEELNNAELQKTEEKS